MADEESSIRRQIDFEKTMKPDFLILLLLYMYSGQTILIVAKHTEEQNTNNVRTCTAVLLRVEKKTSLTQQRIVDESVKRGDWQQFTPR